MGDRIGPDLSVGVMLVGCPAPDDSTYRGVYK